MLKELSKLFTDRHKEPERKTEVDPRTFNWEEALIRHGFEVAGDKTYLDSGVRRSQVARLVCSDIHVELLASCVPDPEARKMTFTSYAWYKVEPLVQDIFRLIETDEQDVIRVAISHVRDVMRNLDENGMTENMRSTAAIIDSAQVALLVATEPTIIQLLGNDPLQTAALIEENVRRDSVDDLAEQITTLSTVLRRFPDIYERLRPMSGHILVKTLIESRRAIPDLARNPDLFDIVLEHFSAGQTWSSSLEAISKMLDVMRGTDVTQEEVNKVILSQYSTQRAAMLVIKNHPELQINTAQQLWELLTTLDSTNPLIAEYVNQCIFETVSINHLPPEKKYSLITSLRQRIGVSGIEILSKAISGTPEHQAHSDEREKGLEVAKATALRKESKFHPANALGLTRRTGFEIEHPYYSYQRTFGERKLLMEMIGIHCGGGGSGSDEISPGPFFDPLTGIEVFRAYLSAGILDFYGVYGHTFHFNTALPTKSHTVPVMIWSLYAAGASYGPEFSNYGHHDPDGEPDESGQYRLRIVPNESAYGEYTECKSFDVMTPRGFEWTYRSGALLSCAAGAYQDVLDELHLEHADRRQIKSSKLDNYRKQLALIWHGFERDMAKGTSAIGLGKKMRKTAIPVKVLRNLDRQVTLVYPNIESRYRADISVSTGILPKTKYRPAVEMPTVPVQIGNKKWPNIVAFAVETIDGTILEIQKVLDSVEVDAIKEVEQINGITSEEVRSQLILQFLRKYQIKVNSDTPNVELVRIYSQVVDTIKK